MQYPDDIKAKIKLITTKIKNNESLSEIEEDYYNFYLDFDSHIKTFELEQSLKIYNSNNETINKFIREKDRKINNTLQRCKDSLKQIQLKRKLTHIQELKKGNIKLLKYYIEDKYNYDKTNFPKYLNKIFNNTNILKQNLYTGDIYINEANIKIAENVSKGNMKDYTNIIELEHTPYEDYLKRKELYNKIPKSLINANSKDINNIIYYGLKITTKNKTVFCEDRSSLELILNISNLLNNKIDKDYTNEINKFTKEVINNYINGLITNEDLQKYEILNYFPKTIPSTKFKKILRNNNYNLNSILNNILKDDLINNPSNNNYKLYSNNNFDINTIRLLSEISTGNFTNLNILLESKTNIFLISSLPSYYQKINIDNIERFITLSNGRIGNLDNHEIEKDLYDIHILLAIASYMSKNNIDIK